ncbi:GNAT family N-acetyltransferase [Petralouisia muris]|uniref:GNAT family N-acetyltransferase n=1 Tax=Petralouisia muris TaxID=3032872 RepID=A0AC61RRV2_9FIRM|nr:GNAT family N-acetyltransferase [Petralouisia muris]TGY91951.1 GNAT family N-acetyltransferase [Petralouisia muris]
MALQGLILSLKEMNVAKPEDPERFVMEDGLTELLDGIYRYGVQIINLDMFQADSPEKLRMVLELHQLKPEECLMIGATDQTLSLREGRKIAAVGYVNPRLLGQKLDGAIMVIEGFEEVDFYFLERMYQREHGLPWTVIETKRCFLREMTVEDLDGLYELYQGEGMTDFIEGLYEDRKKEEEYTRAYIRNMYPFYGFGMWIAIERATGRMIGRAGLNLREIHGKLVLELGYLIGKEFQNRGFATELCEGILQFAREGTEFEEIHCLIEKGNGISVHLAEKLGFNWQEELKIQGKNMQRYMKSLQF